MFGIFVHYSTRPIYDVSMNLFCWPPSIDIFNTLPGFLWQPLLIPSLLDNFPRFSTTIIIIIIIIIIIM